MSSPEDAAGWNSRHLSAARLLEGGDRPFLLKKTRGVKVVASKVMVVSNSEVPVWAQIYENSANIYDIICNLLYYQFGLCQSGRSFLFNLSH